MTEDAALYVNLDFRADFRQIVEQTLINAAITVDPAEPYDEAVYRYFANLRRRLPAQRYTIVEALDLACPPPLAPGYAELKSELEQGIDVTARLSRKTLKATYEDLLLNDWGITHFHLGLRDAIGDVPGTAIVLYAFVEGDVVHCIGFFPHGSWAKIELLEILHRNWPQAVEHARVKSVALDYNVTDADRAKLRAAGGVILNTVNGAVFLPIGGGYSSAGTSMRAQMRADRAILSVESYEKHVRENIAPIVKDFEAAGRTVGTPPTFHLGFIADGRAIAIEPTAEASIILGPFPL